MVSRRLVLLSLLLVTGACWSAPRRAYYRPLGEPVERDIASTADVGPGWRFEARCQGAYLNVVDGRTLRTVHVQLDVARPSRKELRLPLEGLSIELIGTDGVRQVKLAEAWAGARELQAVMVVAPWARQPLDLFFDDDELGAPPAEAVRLRWRHLGDFGGAVMHDRTFALVPFDLAEGPLDRPPTDIEYGYRDGWYFPGVGELGTRRLVPSSTPRRHHVFHAP